MNTTTQVKELPILFSAPMIRAILEGRKTQTRRIVKPQPLEVVSGHVPLIRLRKSDATLSTWDSACPYGQPGDRLWCKETFQPLWETDEPGDWKTGKGYKFSYPATDGIKEWVDHFDDDALTSKCKPSIHMPRWASRITLEITDVRVERLQDISEEDAKAEGVNGGCLNCGCEATCGCADPKPDHRDAFAGLWQDINGPGSWDANPWVWVISFKRI